MCGFLSLSTPWTFIRFPTPSLFHVCPMCILPTIPFGRSHLPNVCHLAHCICRCSVVYQHHCLFQFWIFDLSSFIFCICRDILHNPLPQIVHNMFLVYFNPPWYCLIPFSGLFFVSSHTSFVAASIPTFIFAHPSSSVIPTPSSW